MARSAGEVKQIRQIQELFHGRFEEEEVVVLLDMQNGNVNQTVEYIFSSEPRDVRQAIGDKSRNPETIESRVANGVALSNHWKVVESPRSIPKTARQFACQPCDHVWWRKVPDRKMVSKCNKCQLKYEAIPRKEEWGWAEFRCDQCPKVFRGFCQRITTSPCHSCHNRVKPFRIIPPTDRGQRGGFGRGMARQRVDNHNCDAPDCIFRGVDFGMGRGGRGRGRGRGRGGYQALMAETGSGVHTCVHPANRTGGPKPKVVFPSNVHASSGSTIDTCLTQDDFGSLVTDIDDIERYEECGRLPPMLPPIFEDPRADAGDESDGRRSNASSRNSVSSHDNNDDDANSGADDGNM